MPRFFYDHSRNPLAVGAQFSLPKELSNHTFVLRLKEGDTISLFNGQGGEFVAEITHMDRWQTGVKILSFCPQETELPYQVTLAQALPEAPKMDWIIEKAVELGVNRIVPLAAERSVVRLTPERAEKRLARWRAIITAASAQCGRNRLPVLTPVVPFDLWMREGAPHPYLLLSPTGTQSLTTWAQTHKAESVTLLIGPEGGFSPEEENLALTQGAIPLSMGTRILRTETAGIVAQAILQAIWDQA